MLVVDDEPEICQHLVHALNCLNYQAEAVTSGEEALAHLQRAHYDLLILEIVMPGMHGVEVMRRVRQLQPELAIIIHTGHATLESAIAAIKYEAADYLVKPVNVPEIIGAMIQALQKRAVYIQNTQLVRMLNNPPEAKRSAVDHTHDRTTLLVPPLQLNRLHDSVTVLAQPQQTVALSGGEAAVLASLMSRPNQVLSCQQLVRATWGDQVDRIQAESIIRPYIFRLRRKLEANPKRPRVIRTFRQRGYLYAAAEHE